MPSSGFEGSFPPLPEAGVGLCRFPPSWDWHIPGILCQILSAFKEDDGPARQWEPEGGGETEVGSVTMNSVCSSFKWGESRTFRSGVSLHGIPRRVLGVPGSTEC